MKRRAVIAALAIGMAFPVLADDQPPEKAQPPYLLRLSDIMIATQVETFQIMVCRSSEELGPGKL